MPGDFIDSQILLNFEVRISNVSCATKKSKIRSVRILGLIVLQAIQVSTAI